MLISQFSYVHLLNAFPFIFVTMKSFYKTSTYGKSDKKMQLSQRAAPIKKKSGGKPIQKRYPTKMWTYGKGKLSETAYYVTGTFLDPDPLTYTERCILEEDRYTHSLKNHTYRNPWLAGKHNERRESRSRSKTKKVKQNNSWYKKRRVVKSAKKTDPTVVDAWINTLRKEDWHKRKKDGKIRDRLRELRSNFAPQAGDDFTSVRKSIEDFIKYANMDYKEEVIIQLEGVIALLFTLQGCQDYTAMLAAVVLYIRKFSDKSLTSHVLDYLKELFEYDAQSGEENELDLEENSESVAEEGKAKQTDWVEMLKDLRDNWAAVKENKLFDHFSKLLGLIVTLELCSASDLTFTVKDYKIWEPDMKIVHGQAVDIFDAALNTVTFFVENISLCWQQNSLRPLLIDDKATHELDEEYATIVMWWELVRNGNLMKVLDISDHEFDRRIEELTTKVRNIMGSLKSFEKKLMNDKFMRLLKIKNDYITMKMSCGIREAPYCVEMFGRSSQGKTIFTEQIIQALLVSAGLPTGKEYQAIYNASDRYMSSWSTDKLVMLIDDLANEKSNHVERPPTRAIIDVANNSPFYANMADLDSKAKIFVEPKLLMVTTNVKDLDARHYSNAPYSVQRRMHTVITVEAKPEFQYIVDGRPQGIDSEKVDAFNKANPNAVFDDIWYLTLEKAVCPDSLATTATYKPINYKGKDLVNISFREAVQYLIQDYAKHRVTQSNALARMKQRENIVKCGVDGCCQIRGMCDDHPETLDKQFGEEIVSSIETAGSIISRRIKRDIFGLDTAIEGAATLAILGAARRFANHWDWMSAVPTPWLDWPFFKNAMLLVNRDKLKRSYIRKTTILWGSVSFWLWWHRDMPNAFFYPASICLGASGLCVQKSMVSLVKRDFEQELVDRNTISEIVRAHRDEHVGKICKACAIVGALYGLSRVYKAWKEVRPQGSLEPITMEDIAKRDAESNVWTTVTTRPLPVNPRAANTTSEQLIGLVEKNLVYGTVQIGEKALRVNGLFLKSNVVVVPHHYFEANVLDVTFRKSNPDSSGGKFCTRLSIAQSVRIPNTDLRICYSDSGGSFKDITKFLPVEKLSSVEFALRWRNKNGELIKEKGFATSRLVNNGVAEFQGLYYESLTTNTFQGMCGATLIAMARPILLGVHLGGRSGTPKGCAGLLNANEVNDAISELRKIEGVVITGSAENFEAQVLGVNIVTGNKLHPKSPLNYMPKNSQVAFFGTCPGMTTFRSDVKVTPISEHVADVMNSPNIYRGPVEEPQWFGWQKCLENLAVPALPYDPELLIVAIRDYKEDMLPLFRSHLWSDTRPLTDHENLCGIPGKKFIDSIKLNTSIGYPLGGAKRRFVTELPPTDDKPNNRIFDEVITNEIDRCLGMYRRGERAYVIAKACKKDEVLAKEKCRIFYGNGIALTFLVRKYFLPILRVMQFNPKVSECAVGVNSHGSEWQELHEHILTFGEDRLIGGDYGKYDQKLPAQLILAALRIMIDFARECDYSEEDLLIMEAMCGDIVYAMIAYNGDLIGLTEGSHISGNSCTVIINGICGSLNLRCYFYAQNPSATFADRKRFRDYVKLITYGDDNIGSVSKRINNFTIRGASEFLAVYGQTYTMPDKESELLDFLPPEEFEFLKRKSIYHEALDTHVGALVDQSCFKMLHCFLRSKGAPLTEEHASAQNVDTALREWFNHGPEIYETRRLQLIEVARRAGIEHLCTELDVAYDARVREWKDKYLYGKVGDTRVDIVSEFTFL